jgi:glyoxylase-like metal-dependent hydrolase (beta-lactamase superfamily II)
MAMHDPVTVGASSESTTTYEVTAVRYGSLRASKSDLYYRYGAYGEPDAEVEMAYYFWVLRDGETTVLVDTGFDPDAAARRGRDCLIEPLQALTEAGVSTESVSTVVISHFHYDHVGNLGAFPEAEVIAPRAELEFWTGPLARRPHFAMHVEETEIDRLRALAEAGTLRTTEGEREILPGITAIEVGGHSPGQQLLVVATEGGRVVLTSDAVHFYEELDLDRPFGVIADLGAMYSAYDRVKELGRAAGTVVVPGHDPEVAKRFASSGESGPAVRLDAGTESADA